MVDIIKKFLDAGFGYVLPGKIQSDRLEREFVIYRCSSGNSYRMRAVVNSWIICLKIIKKLDG